MTRAEWFDDARAAVAMIRASAAGDRAGVKSAAAGRDPAHLAVVLADLYAVDLQRRMSFEKQGALGRYLRGISASIDRAEARERPEAAYARAAERDGG